MMIPRILITPGEPAGCGPDTLIQLAQKNIDAELIAIADPNLLTQRAKEINLPLQIITADIHAKREKHVAQTMKVLPVTLSAPAVARQLNSLNANYVIDTLKLATQLCLEKKADALTTGPVHKALLNKAGIPFSGHTEFLASLTKTEQTVMLFVLDDLNLKVALITTHLPLRDVPTAITQEKLRKIISVVHAELKSKFNIMKPTLHVCGLNPHAGESGHLGREEIDVILPVLDEFRAKDMSIMGPLPADTIFATKHFSNTDVVLAMYHDQALPIIKYLGFDRAVNVTLGLPFIRTSVDHGTALDIAGTDKVNGGSMNAAVTLAIKLSSH